MRKLKYPIGISDFAEMRNNGYYYIDKTNLIVDLLDKGPVEVTQITRPRRFGKTLGMSTLANFLDIRKDSKQLFEGLAISKNTELCKKWMNQCPVVFFSFKDTDGLTFESAYGMLRMQKLWMLCRMPVILPFSRSMTGCMRQISGMTMMTSSATASHSSKNAAW